MAQALLAAARAAPSSMVAKPYTVYERDGCAAKYVGGPEMLQQVVPQGRAGRVLPNFDTPVVTSDIIAIDRIEPMLDKLRAGQSTASTPGADLGGNVPG